MDSWPWDVEAAAAEGEERTRDPLPDQLQQQS